MTTETIASSTAPTTSRAVRAEERPATALTPVPDQHDMTGAYILYVVTTLMAITIGVSLWVASSIDY